MAQVLPTRITLGVAHRDPVHRKNKRSSPSVSSSIRTFRHVLQIGSLHHRLLQELLVPANVAYAIFRLHRALCPHPRSEELRVMRVLTPTACPLALPAFRAGLAVRRQISSTELVIEYDLFICYY